MSLQGIPNIATAHGPLVKVWQYVYIYSVLPTSVGTFPWGGKSCYKLLLMKTKHLLSLQLPFQGISLGKRKMTFIVKQWREMHCVCQRARHFTAIVHQQCASATTTTEPKWVVKTELLQVAGCTPATFQQGTIFTSAVCALMPCAALIEVTAARKRVEKGQLLPNFFIKMTVVCFPFPSLLGANPALWYWTALAVNPSWFKVYGLPLQKALEMTLNQHHITSDLYLFVSILGAFYGSLPSWQTKDNK